MLSANHYQLQVLMSELPMITPCRESPSSSEHKKVSS